jgi:cell wall assembly regulator SMI1
MNELWIRLEALAKKAKKPLGLRKGVSERTLAAAEKKMKLALPTDFRASLLLHDGQKGEQDDLFEWMPGCSPLASLDAIVAQWADERDNAEEEDEPEVDEDPRLHRAIFHPKRVPIAGTPYWDGDTTHLDRFPGPKGTSGQLVTLVTECDRVVLGESFSAALASYVDALESGQWKGASPREHASQAFADYLVEKAKKHKEGASSAVARVPTASPKKKVKK